MTEAVERKEQFGVRAPEIGHKFRAPAYVIENTKQSGMRAPRAPTGARSASPTFVFNELVSRARNTSRAHHLKVGRYRPPSRRLAPSGARRHSGAFCLRFRMLKKIRDWEVRQHLRPVPDRSEQGSQWLI